MITVTGKIEDATGAPLHATIDFVSKSTPLAGSGIVTTNTDDRIRSNPGDGTFSAQLAPGNYAVTVTAAGQTSAFNIAVPAGTASMTIDQLVSTPLVYPFVAPNVVWNGQTSGNITFLPSNPPPAPTTSEIAFAGGNVDAGANKYSYWVSYVTATGETNVSPVLQVNLLGGSARPNQANRIFVQPNQTGVVAIRIWRTFSDDGFTYDPGSFPLGIGLLASVPNTAAYYDDWESTAQFAARVDQTISAPGVNTTAGKLLSNTGVNCAYISAQGLVIPSPMTVQASVVFPGANLRITPGVGLELYNFDTKQWHTLVVSGNPAQLGLSSAHS